MQLIENAKDKFKGKTKGTKEKIKVRNKQGVIAGRKRSMKDSSGSSEDSSSDSYTSSGSSTSSDSSASGVEIRRKNLKRKNKKGKRKGKALKSGIKAKAHKIRLKTSELCAQAVLDEEHYPGNHELEELSFDQPVAGELEICTMKEIAKKERQVRLRILKLLAYFTNILSQTAILDVYKVVILKVEKGLFSWSNDLVIKAENMLDRAVSKMRTHKYEKPEKDIKENKMKDKNKKEIGLATKQGDKVVYCLDYNKGQCDKMNSHIGKFAGKEVLKHHVCRTCLATDKEQRTHPEGDETCPNKKR